jgi:hypothetical protein
MDICSICTYDSINKTLCCKQILCNDCCNQLIIHRCPYCRSPKLSPTPERLLRNLPERSSNVHMFYTDEYYETISDIEERMNIMMRTVFIIFITYIIAKLLLILT